MGFKKISYLIPCCDGCGLAWSFSDLRCAEGIPPHFASRAAGLDQLGRDYGWRITRRPAGRPVMACAGCAAGAVPAAGWRGWPARLAGWLRRYVPLGRIRPRLVPGLAPGHPESLTTALPEWQEELLAALDADIFPGQDAP